MIIQNQVIDDEQANFYRLNRSLKDGTVTLNAYSDWHKRYNDEVVKQSICNDQDILKVE